MRHRVDHRKLGRTAAHRKAMLANMVTSLFDKERITTTDAKAKEARRTAERLITRAKKGYAAYQEHQSLKEAGKEAESKHMQAVALAHWRQAGRVVRNQSVLKKLFDQIAPQFMERNGGYTRILHLGNRLGDNAKTVLLELVGTEVTSEPVVTKSRKKSKEKGADEAVKTEEPVEAKEKTKEKTKKSEKKDKEEAKAEKEAKAESAEEPETNEETEEAGGSKEEKTDS